MATKKKSKKRPRPKDRAFTPTPLTEQDLIDSVKVARLLRERDGQILLLRRQGYLFREIGELLRPKVTGQSVRIRYQKIVKALRVEERWYHDAPQNLHRPLKVLHEQERVESLDTLKDLADVGFPRIRKVSAGDEERICDWLNMPVKLGRKNPVLYELNRAQELLKRWGFTVEAPEEPPIVKYINNRRGHIRWRKPV